MLTPTGTSPIIPVAAAENLPVLYSKSLAGSGISLVGELCGFWCVLGAYMAGACEGGETYQTDPLSLERSPKIMQLPKEDLREPLL